MRYTLITPTLVRQTLPRLCQSIDSQASSDWEHILTIDRLPETLTDDQHSILFGVMHPQRKILFCDRPHRDFGHGCRSSLVKRKVARGEYVFHLDDDDYLADSGVLTTLEAVTAPWAIFPVLRDGSMFYDPRPGDCRTTISSYIIRTALLHDLGFPAGKGGTDSKWVEEVLLPTSPKYQTFPDWRPLVVIPYYSEGAEEARLAP